MGRDLQTIMKTTEQIEKWIEWKSLADYLDCLRDDQMASRKPMRKEMIKRLEAWSAMAREQSYRELSEPGPEARSSQPASEQTLGPQPTAQRTRTKAGADAARSTQR